MVYIRSDNAIPSISIRGVNKPNKPNKTNKTNSRDMLCSLSKCALSFICTFERRTNTIKFVWDVQFITDTNLTTKDAMLTQKLKLG